MSILEVRLKIVIQTLMAVLYMRKNAQMITRYKKRSENQYINNDFELNIYLYFIFIYLFS